MKRRRERIKQKQKMIPAILVLTMVLKTKPGIEPFFLISSSTSVFDRFLAGFPGIDRFWGF